jgi:hypothetical protein
MEGLVSTVGAFVAGLCAMVLLRAYFRVRKRLLLWSGICFAWLAASNLLVFVDLELLPGGTDLYPYRLATAAIGTLVLAFGLVLDSE